MSDKPSIVLVHGFWGGAGHWAKVIVELRRRGYDSLHAVENPLTSLADDVGRTRTMVEQVDGQVLLVGHSYGGAVITEAGDLPNVIGLVYVAAFAPDAGESLAQIGDWLPAEAAVAGNVEPDSDGYVWIKQDKFRESFCQDLSADEALVMAVTQKAPLGSTFGDTVSDPAWKNEADLVPGLDERPHDPPGHRASYGRADEPTAHDRARGQPRLAGLAARRNRGSDRPGCRRSQRDHGRSRNDRPDIRLGRRSTPRAASSPPGTPGAPRGRTRAASDGCASPRRRGTASTPSPDAHDRGNDPMTRTEHAHLAHEQTRANRRLGRLGPSLDGKIVLPEHAGWDDARRAWQLNVDQRPAAVVYPESPDDVVAATLFAREWGLRIAAQATGHNAGALGPLDDTVLLKTERMRSLSIDPAARIARADAGIVWRDLVPAAREHGFHRPPWLRPRCRGRRLQPRRRHQSDRAQPRPDREPRLRIRGRHGRRPTAPVDRAHEPDLFWALRGGGGSFAIVTAIELELLPTADAYAGLLWYPAERAGAVLRAWRDLTEVAPPSSPPPRGSSTCRTSPKRRLSSEADPSRSSTCTASARSAKRAGCSSRYEHWPHSKTHSVQPATSELLYLHLDQSSQRLVSATAGS